MLDMSSPFRRRNKPSFFSKYRPRQASKHSTHQESRPQRKSNVEPQHWLRFLTLIVISKFIIIFIVTSLGSYVQSELNLSSNTLKKWTTQISTETFVAALSMEVPYLYEYNHKAQLDIPQGSHMMVEMITSFNPRDPRTLIRREIPGFAFFDGEIIKPGEGVGYTDIPIESSPPLEVVMAEREAVMETLNGEPAEDSDQDRQPELSTDGREVVYIYHTHNRESWLPHIPSAESPNEAFHSEINITKVGERLGQELERRGIGTYVDTTDISQKLNDSGLPFSLSYAKSREVVETAMADKKDITFMFDLHRDSVRKDRTTIDIDGKSYARTFFVIGKRNSGYEKNLQFASELHELLEKQYPGLSRGIYTKETGNAEYNQSLSENNVLIEIGGVDNQLEESYRTAEALADIIADFYWDAEKVDGSPQ